MIAPGLRRRGDLRCARAPVLTAVVLVRRLGAVLLFGPLRQQHDQDHAEGVGDEAAVVLPDESDSELAGVERLTVRGLLARRA